METLTSAKLHTCLSIFTFLCCISGDLAQLQLPQKNVEVIKGKTVVLQASYTGVEFKKNTVVWNYMSSSTEMALEFQRSRVHTDEILLLIITHTQTLMSTCFQCSTPKGFSIDL